MADTLKIIIDEIRTTLKQTFDDKAINRAQIAFWIITVGNKMLGQHIIKRDSGANLNVYLVPIINPKENNLPSIIKGRKYIEIPAAIFDFDKDSGIEYVAYYDPDENCVPEYRKKVIQRTSPSELQWLYLHESTKPSPKNAYYERIGDILRLSGLEAVPIKQLEIGIYQLIPSLTEIDINAEFIFPAELLSDLKRQVIDLAKFSFFITRDVSNDGGDESGSIKPGQIPKSVSVNQQQPEQ
jgi:hypothetical protein